MPAIIPKPPAPMKPVDLATPTPQAPGLCMADVVALLDARDKVLERQIDALSKALAAAVQSLQAQPKPPAEPRKGATIKVHRDGRGLITSADIVPNTGAPAAKAVKKGLE